MCFAHKVNAAEGTQICAWNAETTSNVLRMPVT